VTINRREAIALTAGVLGAGIFHVNGPDDPRSIASDRFAQTLRIPLVLKPDHADADTDYYTLVERESTMEILPGHKTRIWGYNGSFPGPTLVAQHGRRCRIEVRNELGVPTATHLHGGVTESDSDGFPTEMVMPGQNRTFTYSNAGRASALWYHDHSMDHTGHNIYMGLAGLYLVTDKQDEQLNLPAGDFDIPLLLQQRQFATDGSFAYHMGDHIGAGGDTTLVNGVPWPRLTVRARKYRFRIVNGSNSTVYTLALSSGNPLIQSTGFFSYLMPR
jgi:spore coat protein A, manganese oxidase